jgi:hypothetical protein
LQQMGVSFFINGGLMRQKCQAVTHGLKVEMI